MHKPQKIGLVGAIALVMGNMIGGGIFLLPSTLASYGGISMIGWVFSGLGVLLLAYIFSQLSQMVGSKDGGPYTYTREGFGDFMGFLIAWGYWVSIWVANAAITVAFVGAVSVFFPILKENTAIALFFGLSTIWLLVWINTRGVKTIEGIQIMTTILKIVPILLVSIGGLFFFNPEYFQPFNTSSHSDLGAIQLSAAVTLYAFLGFESATIPVGLIDKPKVNIPKATVWGTLLTALVYIVCTFSIMGMIEPGTLKDDPAPFATAAIQIGGSGMRYFIAAGVAIATFGALNGWMLILGQIPKSIAEDDLFPKVFRQVNAKGVPARGIVIGSLLVSLILAMNYSATLVKQFEFLTLLTTLSVLTPYLFSSAAYILLRIKQKPDKGMLKTYILSGLAFVYCMWSVIGAGQEVVFWGFILLLLGVPFYLYIKISKENNSH